MDPFEKLPEDIYDNLLQHFNYVEVYDVLSCVSKNWYNQVASSAVCMKKIKLNLRSMRKNDFSERIETLKWMSRKDGRKYQHLQIHCLLDEGVSNEAWSFLGSVSESVETINIRSLKLDKELKEISLPKLEELKMMFVPRDAMNLLLNASSCLKKLILRNEFSLCYDDIDYTPTEATINSIKDCINKNTKLEELEIQGRPNFLSFFHQDLTETIKFQLKKLVVKIEMPAEKVIAQNLDNLIKFLVHQAPFLQHVYIDSCGSQLIQHIFKNMPVLNFIRFDIELRDPNKVLIKDLNLLPNEKITQIEIPYILLLDDIKDFLELTPNVEQILVGHLSPRLIEFVGKHLMKLQSIVYRYDDCYGGCEDVYRNLKHENPEMNKNIKFTMCNEFM